jgi:hypothetical protein
MRKLGSLGAFVVVGLLAVLGVSSIAGGSGRDDDATARLSGFQETPAVSTTGTGSFRADIRSSSIRYRLSYRNLTGTAAQAHIHLGQRDVAGGVAAFLCGGGDKPACPASGAVTGVIDAADVVDLSAQGLAPGEFAELVRAMRAGKTYANVHTNLFPAGEIRGQIAVD